jgi:DNA-binding response OmpR family regulator
VVDEPAAVVVVEDDDAVADLLTTTLRRAGYRPLLAGDGESGLDLVRRHRPVLAIVDVGLPGTLDGFDVCRELVSSRLAPVLMLTARAEEVDRILGLELGADDYVTKPFSPRELVARVKVILRRPSPSAMAAPPTTTIGPIEVDAGRAEARLDGRPVDLAPREWALLLALVQRRGQVLTRGQLLAAGWGEDWVGDERTVDVHVRQLRRKLGDALPLTTVRRTGYRLD